MSGHNSVDELFDIEIPERYLDEEAEKDWIRSRRKYEENPDDLNNAWHFLYDHPANRRWHFKMPYSAFEANLSVMVVKVNAKKDRILDDKKKNRKTQVWLEWGPYSETWEMGAEAKYYPEGCSAHDPRVDTGGDTFDQAVINLAHNVWKLYGSRARIGNDEKLSKKDRQ